MLITLIKKGHEYVQISLSDGAVNHSFKTVDLAAEQPIRFVILDDAGKILGRYILANDDAIYPTATHLICGMPIKVDPNYSGPPVLTGVPIQVAPDSSVRMRIGLPPDAGTALGM